MNEKFCKVCLKTVYNDFHTIEESLKGHIDELLLNENPNILKETVMCNECVSNLQAFFNFKTTYGDETLPLNDLKKDICLDLDDIKNTNNIESVTESKDQIKCCFCIKLTGREDLISLNDSEENIFIVEKLEEHISEMNSTNTEERLSCEKCLGILHGVLSFVINCLDVEEKVKQYIDIEDKGNINLNEVQQFTMKPNIKSEVGCCNVNDIDGRSNKNQELTIKTETKIKDEITDNLNLIPETEELNIKSELNDCNNFQEITMDNSKICSFQCEVCSFSGATEAVINKHMLTHKIPSVTTTYKCEICAYKTPLKGFLDRHIRSQVCSEGKMFKCKMCTFKAKHSASVYYHMRIHKDPSELTIFKCALCTYETNRKNALHAHMLVHKDSSEITMYKCEMCTFETKYKRVIQRHLINHKDPSQVTMYKCELCTYESKHKYNINKHLRIHRKPPKPQTSKPAFKCEMCTYETNHNRILKQHMLIHKSTSELIMHKCEMCAYETKRKGDLKRHSLCHKRAHRGSNIQV